MPGRDGHIGSGNKLFAPITREKYYLAMAWSAFLGRKVQFRFLSNSELKTPSRSKLSHFLKFLNV
jgi:hypothetical protein